MSKYPPTWKEAYVIGYISGKKEMTKKMEKALDEAYDNGFTDGQQDLADKIKPIIRDMRENLAQIVRRGK